MREREGRGAKKKTWAARGLPGPEARRLAARWSGRALLAAGIGLGIWASLEVREAVRADERFFIDGWRIEVGNLPAWVTGEIRDEVEALGASRSGRWSLLDPDVLPRVRASFESCPWVSRVLDMRIRYPTLDHPGMLGLDLQLRRPIALVELGGLYYPTDAEGRRLGSPYREAPSAWFGIPVIVGLPSPGLLPAPGETWPSRDAAQGIEVARILFENDILRDFAGSSIDAIDLSNLNGRRDPRESEIVLWRGRQRLAWGRSPISSGPRTAGIPEIIANLRFVLSHPETYASYALIHLHRRQEGLTGVRG